MLTVAIITAGVAIAGFFGHWFFHPLHGLGYQFWSGIAGSFLTSLPGWCIAGTLWTRHHNCGHKGCWRLGHAHPEHGQPMCPKHFFNTPHGFQKHHGLHPHWHHAKVQIAVRTSNGD